MPALAEVAGSAIPPGTGGENGTESEERMIRMRAVEGLGALALAGEEGAVAALEACTHVGNATVRATAVHAYLRIDPTRAAALPESDRWMAAIRDGDVVTDAPISPPTSTPAPSR